MNCKSVNQWTIFALVLTLIIDLFFLIIEIVNQACNENDEKDRQKKDEEIKQEIDDLRKEVSILKKQIKMQTKNDTIKSQNL